MIYRLLADFTFVAHLCFVLFVIFGGAAVFYRRFIMFFHLPALLWGILIEFFQLPCPLTSLENQLRRLGGEAGYSGGFIEHYISAILYPSITAQTQIFFGAALISFNLLVYALVLRRRNRI